MGTNEVVSASRVWEYFQSNKGSIKDHMYLIAENKDFGVEVYISNDSGLPEIIVTADDVAIFCETALNEIDCKETVQSVYDIYLTEKAVLAFMDDEDFDEEMVEDYIGTDEYTEYPYDDMEFSDMNNPIYKNKG